jgi:hypothetical protein
MAAKECDKKMVTKGCEGFGTRGLDKNFTQISSDLLRFGRMQEQD